MLHAWGMTEMSPLGSVCRPRSYMDDRPEAERYDVRAKQGAPIAGVDMRIVDDTGRVLPWDGKSVGEIQVRGPWVTSGYYNNPEGAAQFTEDGWFRTGDVASLDADGYIQITDRTKDLIKSGGEWISSVDMETTIMGHPKVLEAAVIAVSHPTWVERPLACVVPKPEFAGQLTAEEIMDYLTPRVAKWWLPDRVVFIDAVPKTSVGKFDKKVLRERFKDDARPDSAARDQGARGAGGGGGGADRLQVLPLLIGQDGRRGPRGPGRELAKGGDPIARARMGRQIAQHAPGVLALGQLLEEADHPVGSDAGGEEQLHPVPVRLLLRTAAVLELAENPRALEPVGERPRHVSGEGREQQPGRRVLDHRAGRVPVQDVLDLVGEDPRELVGCARPLEQAAEDHDVAARRGERIDVRGVDHARPKRVGRGGAAAVRRATIASSARCPLGFAHICRAGRAGRSRHAPGSPPRPRAPGGRRAWRRAERPRDRAPP